MKPAQKIIVQRYKERADEYRYFPEPDLPIVEISPEWVEDLRQSLPALPDELQRRFIHELKLSAYDAAVLTAERSVAAYFQVIVDEGIDAKIASNWITTDLFRLMKAHDIERESIDSLPITAKDFAGLLTLVEDDAINQSTARKKVLPEMWKTGKTAKEIVEGKRIGSNLGPDNHPCCRRIGHAGQPRYGETAA